MKLFLVSQSVNNDFDTYSSFVVCAASPEDARMTHPDGYRMVRGADGRLEAWYEEHLLDWCKPEMVEVEYLGEAHEGATHWVVCASFRAG